MSRPTVPSPLIPRATGSQTWTRRRVTAALGGLLMAPLAAPADAQEAEPPLDPRLAADTVTFQVRKHIFKGSLVRPRVGPKRPGILLIPDQRGPNPYWRGLARRFAMDGFVVLLPDLLAPFNLPEGSDEGLNLMARIIPAEHQLALDAAADLLAKHPECNGSIAVIGFVWGGPYAMQFAIAGARVKAAVVYYATLPSPEKVATVKVPVLFHWAENDPRTAPQIETVEKRMIGAARVFESWVYPGLAGGFASDPGSRTYDKDAADRAYDRTVFFLRRHFGVAG
jgi:carboxymethylenebutenolidase